MTIKNLHIIHFAKRIKKKDDYLNLKWRYICCGSYTKEKSTEKKSKVTCKNCLRVLEKEKGVTNNGTNTIRR